MRRQARTEQKVITMDVPMRGGRTWYTRFGNWPWFILLVAVLAVSIWQGEIKPRRAHGWGQAPSVRLEHL